MSAPEILAFATQIFNDPLLTLEEAQTLMWSMRTDMPSPEKDVIAKGDGAQEIRRCLTRFNCLLYQLMKGPDTFEQFRQAQSENASWIPPIKLDQYTELCRNFEKLDPLTVDCLRVSTILSSVPLSPAAKAAATKANVKFSQDSVEFLSDTFADFAKARLIYPPLEALLTKYPAQKDQQQIRANLQMVFSSERHYRHMLYTEGNGSMFRNLINDVALARISKETFQFWRRHWIINIAGFRGQLNPHGSMYLTSNTFRAMHALDQALEMIWKGERDENKILTEYLKSRAQMLGFNQHSGYSFEELLVITHVGAMLRLFHPIEGKMLLVGWGMLPVAVKANAASNYFQNKPSGALTDRFAPAMFENMMDYRKSKYDNEDFIPIKNPEKYPKEIQELSDKIIQLEEAPASVEKSQKEQQLRRLLSIPDAIGLAYPIYDKAQQMFKALQQKGKIAPNVPLSFMKAAKADQIASLVQRAPIAQNVDILQERWPTFDDQTGFATLAHPDRVKAVSRIDNLLWHFPQHAARGAFEAIRNQALVGTDIMKPFRMNLSKL